MATTLARESRRRFTLNEDWTYQTALNFQVRFNRHVSMTHGFPGHPSAKGYFNHSLKKERGGSDEHFWKVPTPEHNFKELKKIIGISQAWALKR